LKMPLKATVYMGVPVEVRTRTPSVNRTLGIQIGSICCGLRCPDDEVYQRLRRLYWNFLTEQSADVTIELERTPGWNGSAGDDQVFSVVRDEPDTLIVEMECSPAESDTGFKHLNRLFYLAYYSACLEKYGGSPPAMLVHACGVLRRGRALVLAGPSNSGKTTIAGLCGEKDGRVINDEMVLLSRPGRDGGTSVQSVPIIGAFPPGINITVPLSCILLLKKGSRTRVAPMTAVDAYLRFIRQIITPTYLGQREGRTAGSMVADFSQETTGAVPVYELEFTLDGGSLWREIGELEAMMYGQVMK
jgi:hypothetical protein